MDVLNRRVFGVFNLHDQVAGERFKPRRLPLRHRHETSRL